MNVSTSKKRLIGVAGAAAVFAAVAVAVAHDRNDRSPAVAPTNAPASPTSLGMIAAKDPVTGQFVAPTAEQIRELQAQQPATTVKGARSSGPVEQRLRNGAYITTLDSSYEVASVAVKQPDGKVVTACVPNDQVQATLDAAQKQTLTTKEVLDEK